MLLTFLPVAAFILIFTLRVTFRDGIRQALIDAAVIWASTLVGITETLSQFERFTKSGVLSVWATLVLLLILFAFRNDFRKRLEYACLRMSKVSWSETVGVVIVCLMGITFISAVVAPPNNWDGHSYHLPRVMHWIQNQTVAHYPTQMEKQLIFPPWAEFSIAHFSLLSGGDRYANLIQWFSYCLLLSGVSLLTKKFGISQRGQLLTAAFSATLPMAILQSSSVQNDLVVACWSVIFVNGCVDLIQQSSLEADNQQSFLKVVLTGLSAGLAVLTKGTAPIYIVPFFLLFFVEVFCQSKAKALKQSIVMVSVAMILNFGHFARNTKVFATPISTPPGLSLQNEEVSFRVTCSNLLRNLLLHVPLPARFTGITRKAMDALHRPLGIDPLDSKTSFEGSTFAAPILPNSEHDAGNPIQMVFILLAIVALLQNRSHTKNEQLERYLGAMFVSVCLFCTLLKWQQYNSRLHLVFFFLASPLIGFSFEGKKKWARVGLLAALLVSIIPLFFSITRPWFGAGSIFKNSKETLYFIERPELLSRFRDVAREIGRRNCKKVGLMEPGPETWAYPIWVMLDALQDGIKIKYVNFTSKSRRLETQVFEPCATVALSQIRVVD